MTRVLVHGGADIDDPYYVHKALTQVNKTYGPISCVIHMNNARALAWQQYMSRHQITRHLPITAQWQKTKDASIWDKLYTRLFTEGRPDMLVLLETRVQSAEEKERLLALTYRAQRRLVPVIRYAFDPSRPQHVREQGDTIDETLMAAG